MKPGNEVMAEAARVQQLTQEELAIEIQELCDMAVKTDLELTALREKLARAEKDRDDWSRQCAMEIEAKAIMKEKLARADAAFEKQQAGHRRRNPRIPQAPEQAVRVHKREYGHFSFYMGQQVFHLCCGMDGAKEGMNPNCCSGEWDAVDCKRCLARKPKGGKR